MPTLKDYQNPDSIHDPSQKAANGLVDMEQKAGENAGVNAGIDQLEQFANDPANGSKAIQSTNQSEQTPDVPDKYNWGDSQGKESPAPQSLRARLTGFGKKRSAIAGIGGGILGIGTIFAIFLSPALVLQQFVETMTGEFNDQLSAMDMRSTLLLKKKYNTEITKNCKLNPMPCKYQTIREKSGLAKRLKNAGIEIEGDKSVVPGRIKPSAFIFDGKRIEAKNLVKEASKDPQLRAALRRGYDPLYAGFSDKLSGSIRTKLGLKRSSSIDSSTDKDKMNEDLKKVASRTDELPASGNPLTEKKTTVDGKEVITYFDDEGKEYTQEAGQRINNVLAESIGREELASKVTKTAIKSSVKGALLAPAMGAGAVDGLCTAWTLIRVAGYAAKYFQQRQVISYYYEVAKAAHEQRYGDMTPEKMSFWGEKFTSINKENKAALDSAGYRYAAYGDTFQPGSFTSAEDKSDGARDKAADKLLIQNETSRYVNGQLLNSNTMTDLVKAISNNESGEVESADKICKFTKSWKGQALVVGAALAGVAVAVLTGGFSLGAGAVMGVAASVTVSVALALLQPKLIDMAKGEVIKGDENGNETGNALTSGAGGYNAQTAQRRGLRPATNEVYAAYSEKSQQIAAERAEEERKLASPFDATNRNTFVGSIVSQLLPIVSKQQTVGSTGQGILSLVGTTFSSFNANSAGAASGDKYQQCEDPEYTNIAADPFCNLRYAATNVEVDPEIVLEYMLKGGPNGAYISNDDPTPQGDYKEYVEKCIDRESSIGDKFTDYKDVNGSGSADDGTECVIGRAGANEQRNEMFSLFYIDTSIEDGMDNDFEDGTAAATTEGASFRATTFNILHEPDGIGDCDWKCRLEASATTLKDNDIDIAGLQEARPEQQKLLKSAKYGGDVYDIYPQNVTNGSGPNQNPDSVVLWDKSKFSLVEGRQKAIKYAGGERKVNIVKLQYIENGAEGPQLYALNTHDPINDQSVDGGGPANRKDNNDMYASLIKDELTDAPVVFAGDFNSKFTVEASQNKPAGGLKENLAYCILTRDDLLVHVSDAQEAKTGECPSTQDVLGRNDVDHIFISPSMTASGYGIAKRNDAATKTVGNGGDHDMVYADLEIPAGASSSGAGSTFVIGTYNQKRSLSESAHSSAAKNIVDNNMDVVGTQETSNPKYSRYRAYLGSKNYGVYPTSAGSNQTCSNAQAIFFNKTKFKLLKGEYFEIPRYPDPATDCGNGEKTTASHSVPDLPKVWSHMPIVWLQDAGTGQTVIVMNAHNVANVQGAAGTKPSKSRFESNKIFVQQVERLKSENPGIPIFFTGDFNEGTNVRTSNNVTHMGQQGNLLFCMFAENGLMKSAAGPAMKCDPKYSIGTVDYIYVTPEVTVDWTKEIASGGSGSGPPSYTDHPVRYAQMTVPGSGGSTPGGSIAGDDYKGECNNYIGAGDCTGECAGFVKFRLVKHGVINLSQIPDGIGNGGQVTATLKGLGFTVNGTPAVNSVMSLKNGSWGHTAMVSKVNADGSIVVEEYNWAVENGYGTRTIPKSTLDRQIALGDLSFAHTETKYK